MSVTAPPSPPPPQRLDDPEALIEEARRRTRRRRAGYAVAALLALGFGLGVFFGVGGNGGGGSSTGRSGAPGGQSATRAQELRQIERAAARSTIGEAGLVAPGVGWAMNGLGLWWTHDGGEHWGAIAPPRVLAAGDVVARITQVEFVDLLHGWITASDIPGTTLLPNGSLRHMLIERTSDGGQTWQSSIPRGCAACDGAHLSFLDARYGYALAELEPRQPRLYETTDGGATWKRIADPPFTGALLFLNRRRGFGVSDPIRWTGPSQGVPVGGGILYGTGDGGRSWRRVQLVKPTRYATFPETVDLPKFFGPRDGVASVRFRDPSTHAQHLVVYVTDDGGRTWSARPAPLAARGSAFSWGLPGGVPFSAATVNDWMLMIGQTLSVTGDAGRHWSIVHARYAPKPRLIWDVDFTSRSSGWAIFGVRSGDALVHTTDGGRDWTPLSPPTP